jgi:RNA polymerase sigma factor (sigma-70 family)
LIRTTLWQKGIRGADLDDQTQEVWLRLLPRLPDFHPRGEASVAGWIRAVARCVGAQFLREASGVRRRVRPANIETVTAGGADPPLVAQCREEEAAVLDALGELRCTLSPENRQIVDGYLLDGRTAKEIAAELGLTEGAIRKRACGLRRRIASALRRRGLTDDGDGKAAPPLV